MDLPQAELIASLRQPSSTTALIKFVEAVEDMHPACCVQMKLRAEGDWIDFYFQPEIDSK